jgi:hypothetical protein
VAPSYAFHFSASELIRGNKFLALTLSSISIGWGTSNLKFHSQWLLCIPLTWQEQNTIIIYLCFFSCDSVNGKPSLDIIYQPEKFSSFLNCHNICKIITYINQTWKLMKFLYHCVISFIRQFFILTHNIYIHQNIQNISQLIFPTLCINYPIYNTSHPGLDSFGKYVPHVIIFNAIFGILTIKTMELLCESKWHRI